MSKSMSWSAKLRLLASTHIVPDVLNRVLLAGIYRAGKSSVPREIWGDDGCEQVTFHKQMPVDDILGGYALVDGTTKWQDGPAVRAMLNGTKLILDEIDQYSPECRCVLHSLQDDPAAVTLPNGQRIKAAPGYAVIATTNASPEALPQGVYDRFDVILRVDELSDGLKTYLGPFADAAQSVARRGIDWRWQRSASVNLFIAAAKLRNHGMTDETIAVTLGLEGSHLTDFLAVVAKR